MSANVPTTPKEHTGRSFGKKKIVSLDTRTQSAKYRRRQMQDDSQFVNMSDSKLGNGIRRF